MLAMTRPLNETCLQSISSTAAPTTMTLSSSFEHNRTLLLFPGEGQKGGFYVAFASARASLAPER